jgi:hypothetical protein
MYRLALITLTCALAASACGSATDDRPPTLDFITETILAPSCASAECHSAFKREVGDQFDTPAAARLSIVANGLALVTDQDDPASSFLVRSLTVGNPSILDPGSGNVRMPYDEPMPDADIELIKRWIAEGVPGAQCVPNEVNRGCRVSSTTDVVTQYEVVECVDGTIGNSIQLCGLNQQCTLKANGQCVAK